MVTVGIMTHGRTDRQTNIHTGKSYVLEIRVSLRYTL